MSRLKEKMKIFIPVAIILILVWFLILFFNPNNLKENKSVEIKKGLSTYQIAEVLKSEKVINSKGVFCLRLVLSEYRGQLKYGKFEFTPEDSYSDIIKKLATKGAKRETVTITIPEGYSCEKIIELLAEKGFGTKNEVIKAMNAEYDYEYLKSIHFPKECKYRLQGFLFPSTYEFYSDATPYEVIDRMLGEFKKQYDSLKASYSDIFTVITKASMVEREAKTDGDRAKIAGVIENRLKIGMKLQIDATVVYAVSDGLYNLDRVLYKDLEVNSPYNTYRYEGLPAGPISSPGLKSIKAALNPEKHNYLYYRTDSKKNDGSHVFSRDFEEHKSQ